MTEIERLFDQLLDDVAAGITTPTECIATCQQSHPELADALRLALELRCPPRDVAAIAIAQARVWDRLEALIDEEPAVPARKPVLASLTQTRWPALWVRIACVAAALALVFIGAWAISTSTASALPDSPLYGIKRAEETAALQLAWSSQRRGEVLSWIALHRLAESRAEASKNNMAQALRLMRESDDVTHQLIKLVIGSHAQHQNDAALDSALAITLQAEYSALNQARQSGHTALAQVLINNVTDQRHILIASNIPIPAFSAPAPGVAPATPTIPAHNTPLPHPTPTPHSTPTPQSNGNNGGTSGGTSGNGGTGGNGNGGGTGGNGTGHKTTHEPQPGQAPRHTPKGHPSSRARNDGGVIVPWLFLDILLRCW